MRSSISLFESAILWWSYTQKKNPDLEYNQKTRNACLRVLVSAMREAHGLQGVPPPVSGAPRGSTHWAMASKDTFAESQGTLLAHLARRSSECTKATRRVTRYYWRLPPNLPSTV